MTDVLRFSLYLQKNEDLSPDPFEPVALPHPEGDFVLFSDYKKAMKKRDEAYDQLYNDHLDALEAYREDMM